MYIKAIDTYYPKMSNITYCMFILWLYEAVKFVLNKVLYL